MSYIQTNIELFHLIFLQHLEKRLDKKLYALKGGCNLRFFFKSIRYSEDIDFDIFIISQSTLENKINKILASPALKQILHTKGIEIIQANAIKQTETIQRWKLLLRIENSALPIPTIIEFSRRKRDENIIYDTIDNDVILQHKLYPISCNHYTIHTALMQKIIALIHRTETQARDIFDLMWLLNQGAIFTPADFSSEQIQTAIQNIQTINYVDFKGQVVAYLMDEYKKFYDSPEKWQVICSKVLTILQGNRYASH